MAGFHGLGRLGLNFFKLTLIQLCVEVQSPGCWACGCVGPGRGLLVSLCSLCGCLARLARRLKEVLKGR